MLALLVALAWFEVPREIERQTAAGTPYAQAFRQVVGSLDDVAAAYAVRAIRDQPALVAEDDARRYVVERDVRMGRLCGLVVRPTNAPASGRYRRHPPRIGAST